jgi:hypothetical protein
MKIYHALFMLLVVAACSTTSTDSGNARKSIEDKYNERIGKATKQDFVQEFGDANWCRSQPTGDESCRFYKRIGTRWIGEKPDRVPHEMFDEIYSDFDSNGVLKSIKVNSQR